MTPQEELKKLRAETRELRQRTATAERRADAHAKGRDDLEERKKYLEKKVKHLEHEVQELGQKKKELEDKVASLEARLAGVTLHKDKLAGMIFKTNHSRQPENAVSRRKLGGQTGHTGHGRKKPAKIDEEKTVFLSNCPTCEHTVDRSSHFYERTVEDVVVPAVTTVTRYTIERQWCSRCHKEVRGTPQNALPGFRLGTKALTLILFLKYRLRLPLEKMKESLESQYGLNMKEGTLAHTLKQLSKKLTPEYQRNIEEIRGSPVKHADETSWRINGQTNWCWAFLTPASVAYTVEETRGKGVPDKMLGEHPSGVLVRDDYGSYTHLSMKQQSCWAHLLRNSRDALKQESVSQEMKELHTELTGLFIVLSAIIKCPFEDRERRRNYALMKKQITNITKRRYLAEDVKAIQTRIRNQNTNLITALLYRNVPLTNNAAERQMRPFAVIRKISGGSRSTAGAKATAINMSVLQTIALKGQSLFDRLEELLTPVNRKFSLERTE